MRWQQKRLSSDPGLALSMELDIENFRALQNYLSLRGHLHPGEAVSFGVLPGGVSNRTVRATWADGRSWVLKQALSKLRVNIDWFSSPERITVEAKALRCLNFIAPPGLRLPLFSKMQRITSWSWRQFRKKAKTGNPSC